MDNLQNKDFEQVSGGGGDKDLHIAARAGIQKYNSTIKDLNSLMNNCQDMIKSISLLLSDPNCSNESRETLNEAIVNLMHSVSTIDDNIDLARKMLSTYYHSIFFK